MKRNLLRGLVIAAVMLLPASALFAQTPVDTAWTDDFSDGDFLDNPYWTLYPKEFETQPPDTLEIIDGMLVLMSSGIPYDAAWAWTGGDTNNYIWGNQYGIYYTVKTTNGGTPGAIINFKDDLNENWFLNIYPTLANAYFMHAYAGEIATYENQANLTQIQAEAEMKVLIQNIVDTMRVKIWTGPFEPDSWGLTQVDSNSIMVADSLLPSIQIGGWWMGGGHIHWDNFMVVNYQESTPISGEDRAQLAEGFSLDQNYPNPFNPSTNIRFSVPRTESTKLTIYDVTGREVRTLVRGWMPAGSHEVTWDGMNSSGISVPSGLYFYKLTSGPLSETKKLLLVK